MAGLVTGTTPLISRRFQDVDAREKCGKAPVVTVTGTNDDQNTFYDSRR